MGEIVLVLPPNLPRSLTSKPRRSFGIEEITENQKFTGTQFRDTACRVPTTLLKLQFRGKVEVQHTVCPYYAVRLIGPGAPKIPLPICSIKVIDKFVEQGWALSKTFRLGRNGKKLFVDMIFEKPRPPAETGGPGDAGTSQTVGHGDTGNFVAASPRPPVPVSRKSLFATKFRTLGYITDSAGVPPALPAKF
jgi:hypothetical protein